MKYPNGKKYVKSNEVKAEKGHRSLLSAANRGMSLEEDINLSNEYYRDMGIALITKRPTPINIVKVDYVIKNSSDDVLEEVCDHIYQIYSSLNK